jgi:NADH:ubiquinone oxidoreductase subunit 2 (subunit N)
MPYLLPLIIVAPLAAAVVCLAFSRRLPTRLMGLVGTAGLLLGLAALWAVWAAGLPAEAGPLLWAALDDTRIELALRIDELSAPLLALVLAGGALALVGLALAFAPRTRGFGRLFAAVLVALTGSLATLASPSGPLLPLGWALIALAGYAAGRLAGASEPEGDLPVGIAASLIAALLLALALMLGQRPAQVAGLPLGLARSGPVLLFLLLAGAMALGLPPLHGGVRATVDAPAGVAAPILSLGLPLASTYTLLRLGIADESIEPGWQLAFVLAGLLTSCVAAACALRERSLRGMLGWQVSGLGGLALAALGLGGQQGRAAALALMLTLALVGLTGMLALVLLERRTGQALIDGLPRLRQPLPLAGAAFAVAAASSLGLPATLGFWGKLWLSEALRERYAWAPALLLAASALSALAWVAPLVAFYRAEAAELQPETPRARDDLLPLLTALPLLALGARPQVLGAPLESSPVTLPPPVLQGLLLFLGLALLAGALWARGLPPSIRLAEERSAPPSPLGLAESLSWLAAHEAPKRWAWGTLLALGEGLRRILTLFEARYYLAGVLLALISTLLLMAQ